MLNWTGDVLESIAVPTNATFKSGHLTPSGAIFDVNYGKMYEWNNNDLIPLIGKNSAWGVSMSDKYFLWKETLGALFSYKLYYRNIETQKTMVLLDSGRIFSSCVADNGLVVFDNNHALFKYENDTITAITSDTALEYSNVITDGEIIIYQSLSSSSRQLVYNKSNNYEILAETTMILDSSFHYQLNNKWIAYTEQGNLGQNHIWTMSPSGIKTQITQYGSNCVLERLGSNGSVMYFYNKDRYLCNAQGRHIRICSDKGKAFHINNRWYVVQGEHIFEVR